MIDMRGVGVIVWFYQPRTLEGWFDEEKCAFGERVKLSGVVDGRLIGVWKLEG